MQQGLESLKDFQKFVSNIGGLGRYEDTYIVHAAEGETVVPMEVLDRNPVLKKRLFKSMVDMGIDPGRYIVGNELNSINPVTGQPEFFLNKIVKRLKKAAGDISGYAAPIAGAMFGPVAGAAVGAGLGSFKRENPGDPNQALQMGLRGGLSGVASNYASGQGLFKGTGARGAYGMEGEGSYNPLNIGKRILGMKSDGGGTKSGMDFFDNFKANPFSDGTDTAFGNNSAQGIDDYATKMGIDPKTLTAQERINIQELIGKEAKKGLLGGMSIGELASLYGLSTAALGLLIDQTTDDEQQSQDFSVARISDTLGPGYDAPATIKYAADGGVMDLRADGGMSEGPGTETSDSIPAMLSDGEFVMTAQAVRGAGDGDRREGAKRMYEMMDQFEGRVA